MKEEHMSIVVNFLDKALMNADNESELGNIRADVNKFMQQFPLYPELG